MEDLSIEDLMADVVANPAPVRVSCQSTPPLALTPTGSPRSVVRAILRRITKR